jgi:hypothetical protein
MTPDENRMAEIALRQLTVSAKIRALDAAGYARADIARFLGKRYQHVRNVLVQGPPQQRADRTEQFSAGLHQDSRQPFVFDANATILRLPISGDGSIRLPAAVLQALGLKLGGVAIAELEGDRCVFLSVDEAVRRVQAMARELAPTSAGRVDDFIAERRQDAAREERGE